LKIRTTAPVHSVEIKQDEVKLANHYHNKFGIPISQAKEIAEAALFIILQRAAGSFPHQEFKPSSEITTLFSDSHLSVERLRSILVDKDHAISKYEIYQGLKAALLQGLQLEYIVLLMDSLTPNNIKEFSNKGEPLLSFSLKNYDILQLLLTRGVPVDAQNDLGKTALFYAIGFNNHEAANLLLRNNANANHAYKSATEIRSKDECIYPNLVHTKRTPLMHAAQNSDVNMIKLLLSHGADITTADELGFNALDYAVIGNNKENISFLKSLGLKPRAPIKPVGS